MLRVHTLTWWRDIKYLTGIKVTRTAKVTITPHKRLRCYNINEPFSLLDEWLYGLDGLQSSLWQLKTKPPPHTRFTHVKRWNKVKALSLWYKEFPLKSVLNVVLKPSQRKSEWGAKSNTGGKRELLKHRWIARGSAVVKIPPAATVSSIVILAIFLKVFILVAKMAVKLKYVMFRTHM